MTKYVIVGGGVAGTTAAEHIRRNDTSGQITIITNEPIPFYNRIRLNDFIANEITQEDLLVKDNEWYREQRIDVVVRTNIIKGDVRKRLLTSDDNRDFQYDTLLLATGSHSFLPQITGVEKKGVFTLRSIDDAEKIKNFAATVDQAVLIGGGLLGIEAGHALHKLGKKIRIVEYFPRLLPRQLDGEGAQRLQKILEKRGYTFQLGAVTEKIFGDSNAQGVVLKDSDKIEGQLIIISAGVRPNLGIASSMNLATGKGITVNEYLQTSNKAIYAAGDVAEFNETLYGIWPAGYQQGKTAGINMTGGKQKYTGTSPATTLKVAGIDLASAGEIDAEGKYESEIFTTDNVYKKIVTDNGVIIGCIMLGDKSDFNTVLRYMTEKKDFSAIRQPILDTLQ